MNGGGGGGGGGLNHLPFLFCKCVYGSSFTVNSLRIGHSLLHGDQLMGECLAKIMIKDANFLKTFSDLRMFEYMLQSHVSGWGFPSTL